jgi:hypothetical protein
MHITKIYETVLNITAIEMYSNLDLIIVDKLRAKYEGVCEKSTLILKIIGVVKRSKCRFVTDRLDGSGSICVQFTAEAIVYHENDILVGCEVQKVERNNRIICKYEHAVVNIKSNKNLQTLKPGQFITTQVINSTYTTGQKMITVNALPYIYPSNFTIYMLDTTSVAFEDIEILERKIVDIDEEYKLYAKANTKLVNKLQDYYYPFKNDFNHKQSLPKGMAYESVYDMAMKFMESEKSKSKTKSFELAIFRHPIIEKSTPYVMTVDQKTLKAGIETDLLDPQQYNITMITQPAAHVFLKLLDDYLKFLRMIREMSEIYNTESKLEDHHNIWNIYQRLKV